VVCKESRPRSLSGKHVDAEEIGKLFAGRSGSLGLLRDAVEVQWSLQDEVAAIVPQGSHRRPRDSKAKAEDDHEKVDHT